MTRTSAARAAARLALATSLAAAAASVPVTSPVAAAPLAAQQQRTPDAGEIIGRAARVYRSLGSLRADFAQQIDDEMVGRSESRGTLAQAGEARLAMRFSEPAGDAIIIDGRQIWVYTPSTTPGQVIRMTLPSGGPVYGFNLLAWLLDRPAERYQARYLGADRVSGVPVDVIELVPLSQDMPFTRAVISLGRADALPRRLEIHERAGGTRTLTLSNLRVNRGVPDATFKFEVPAGVRVVDQ
ncbi:MAG TPA: outer membrane lipoprotein carrier protein LolA [Gemmatimonadales bacterium]|nr:outer membrane lipoprotein carrier protein LolA [Gemmatimonadales bacterium]